jgi:hypothetical protein
LIRIKDGAGKCDKRYLNTKATALQINLIDHESQNNEDKNLRLLQIVQLSKIAGDNVLLKRII